jgi:hypothetical protein
VGRAEQAGGLLALDEFSAVARRVPVHELTERCRSLGLAVQVAAQSWEGLAPGEAERPRLAATASGGVVVMRCPSPDALCRLAGTRRVIEVGRKILGRGRYGDEGTGRIQRAWVVDPDRVRNFRAGQAAWIHGAACTYVQVAPYRRSPLPLPAPSRELEPGTRPGRATRARQRQRRRVRRGDGPGPGCGTAGPAGSPCGPSRQWPCRWQRTWRRRETRQCPRSPWAPGRGWC